MDLRSRISGTAENRADCSTSTLKKFRGLRGSTQFKQWPLALALASPKFDNRLSTCAASPDSQANAPADAAASQGYPASNLPPGPAPWITSVIDYIVGNG
ncbi:uncharacterized protein LOC119376979 [Rhipicephalus sanguineus]|uniref:uncharacterized protein LOC119376979 n=1 Tax=Rhipicephalus sanguineus TaxID=34632 RepID=UPI0020C59D4F|nr:uncharacterized protein LOC119376979 [Rhipicephalus sanguineus]